MTEMRRGSRRAAVGAAAMAALLAGTALAAGAAESGRWDRCFPADRLSSFLPGQPHAYMVVAAGPDARPAAAALQDSLRPLPAARLVMDGAAIGPVDELDDAAIVGKAAPQPVDAV